jgi:hypothetical protein
MLAARRDDSRVGVEALRVARVPTIDYGRARVALAPKVQKESSHREAIAGRRRRLLGLESENARPQRFELMPQIWMTYDELGSLFECDPAIAHGVVIKMNLNRRKSRDGHTRVKLDVTLKALYFERLFNGWGDRKLQTCADELPPTDRRMTAGESCESG